MSRLWALLLLLGLAPGSVVAQESPADGRDQASQIAQVEALLDKATAAIAAVEAYSGILVKRERIGRELKTERHEFKFARPFKVYIKGIEPNAGQEAIYVEGWNDGRVRAHLGHFPDITVNLDPRGRRAMKNNHHPITSFGLENTLRITANNIRKAIRRCEGTFKVTSDIIFGQPVSRIDVHYSKGGRHMEVRKGEDLWDIAERAGQNMYVILHHNPGIDSPRDVDAGDRVFVPCHYAGRGEYFIAEDTNMLLKASSWDHLDELFESYAYPTLVLDTELTDEDFNPKNEAYDF
ncbi:MAG: DUF1571 domain-containing protein [Myxococcota bacterium]